MLKALTTHPIIILYILYCDTVWFWIILITSLTRISCFFFSHCVFPCWNHSLHLTLGLLNFHSTSDLIGYFTKPASIFSIIQYEIFICTQPSLLLHIFLPALNKCLRPKTLLASGPLALCPSNVITLSQIKSDCGQRMWDLMMHHIKIIEPYVNFTRCWQNPY